MNERNNNVVKLPGGKVFADTSGTPLELAEHLSIRNIFRRCGVEPNLVRTSTQLNQAGVFCISQGVDQEEYASALFEYFATLFDPEADPKSRAMHEAFTKGATSSQRAVDHIESRMPILTGRIKVAPYNEEDNSDTQEEARPGTIEG